MNARLEKYRAEYRSMNRAEQKTAVTTLPLSLIFGLAAGLSAADRNWLGALAACIAICAVVQTLIQLRVAAGWRNAYERERDRPRAANWRQN